MNLTRARPPLGQHRRIEHRGTRAQIRVLTWVLPAAAFVLGLFSIMETRESATGLYGLIQALPVTYFVALGSLSVGFLLIWRSEKLLSPQFILATLFLIFLLHGVPAIVESEPRFQSAWLHAGFTDYVAQTGRVLPKIDARFSWPSFFTAMAMLDRAGKLPSAILLIRWWPVAINALYALPLYLIAKQTLRDERKAMLVVWLFPLANWVGQDYYSPQSLAYLLYFVLVCLVTGPFAANRYTVLPHFRRVSIEAPASQLSRWETVCLLGILLLVFVAIATGHQLTPFFAIATAVVLVVAGRTRLLALPAVMVVVAVAWVCYGAVAYWSGHFSTVFGSLDSVGGNVSTDLVSRLRGSPQHYFVLDARLGIFGGLWIMAAVGFFVIRKTAVDRRTAIVLMAAPLIAIAGQPYGGEAGLRAYLFSLPGALCLTAAALTWLSTRLAVAAAAFLIAILIPCFVLARWGNELSERVLPAEISGAEAMYRIAPPGSTLMSITPSVAWEFMDVGAYQYAPENLSEFAFGTVNQIVAGLRNSKHGFVIITTSQLVYAEQNYGLPGNWGETVERSLISSKLFKLVYRNSATDVYEYVGRR